MKENIDSSPLALEINAASVGGVPSNVIVEAFTTRQEASDIYPDLGVFPQPEDADEPVWIVFIDGKADVVNLGAPWRGEKVSKYLAGGRGGWVAIKGGEEGGGGGGGGGGEYLLRQQSIRNRQEVGVAVDEDRAM